MNMKHLLIRRQTTHYNESIAMLQRFGTWLLSVLIFACFTTSTFGIDGGTSLKVGTTGIGADVTVGVSEKLNARVGISGFSKTFSPNGEEEDDENISIKLKLQTIPMLLDWHPRAGNFRTSIGFMLNNNKISLNAQPGDQLDFNDVDYRVDSFSLDLSFNQFAPYLGIGYGNAAKEGRRFVFAFDLGVMFHGTPKVTAKAIASNPAQQSALDRDLEIEITDLRDDVKPFKFYPVLNLGMSYRF